MARGAREIKAVPMTPLMESLRRFIAWSTAAPGIHRLCASVYDAAVRGLVREVSSLPGTVSVLSRNSYPARSFTPGLSDLDVMVVLEDDLDAQTIRSMLGNLYRMCAHLRRRFPMLNPFPVYTRQGFITALELGPPKAGTYAWRCEWGDEHVLAGLEGSDSESSADGPTRSAQIYVRWFHQNLRAALRAEKTRTTLAMERSARQIERASATGAPPNGRAGKGRIPAVVADLLAATSTALRSADLDAAPHPWGTTEREGERIGDVDLETDRLPEGIEAVVSGWDGPAIWFLLSSPVSDGAVAGALELARGRAAGFTGATFLTEELFTFFLRHLNPMAYYSLKAARRVTGIDPVSDLSPPSQDGVKRFYCAEAARMLRLPLHLGSGRQPPTGQSLAHQRRKGRLIHLLECNEILLEDRESPPALEEGRTLLDLILDDMPDLLRRLQTRPSTLFND